MKTAEYASLAMMLVPLAMAGYGAISAYQEATDQAVVSSTPLPTSSDVDVHAPSSAITARTAASDKKPAKADPTDAGTMDAKGITANEFAQELYGETLEQVEGILGKPDRIGDDQGIAYLHLPVFNESGKQTPVYIYFAGGADGTPYRVWKVTIP